MHATDMVSDDKSVLAGSTNMSDTSFYDNGELNIISGDSNVVKPIESSFAKD